MSKHTPGPWSESKPWYFDAPGGKFYFGADCGYVTVGQHGEMYDHALVLCKRGNNEGLANARLIAAAPEMLEALRSTRGFVLAALQEGIQLDDYNHELHPVMLKIDEAIAKATGAKS